MNTHSSLLLFSGHQRNQIERKPVRRDWQWMRHLSRVDKACLVQFIICVVKLSVDLLHEIIALLIKLSFFPKLQQLLNRILVRLDVDFVFVAEGTTKNSDLAVVLSEGSKRSTRFAQSSIRVAAIKTRLRVLLLKINCCSLNSEFYRFDNFDWSAG